MKLAQGTISTFTTVMSRRDIVSGHVNINPTMPILADKIPENIEFVVREILEAPPDERPAMLEQIAISLTRRVLRDNPGIGAIEVSTRVTQFLETVRVRVDEGG